MQKHSTRRRGVTLIELVVVIVLVGILTGLGSLYLKEVIDLWNFVSFRSEAVSTTRVAVTRMLRQMRQVRNDTSVTFANATRFQFTDKSGAVVNFNLSGTTLLCNNNILAEGVRNLSFTYMDNSGTLLLNPAVSPLATNIRLIRIGLTVQAGTQSKTISVQVAPRNL